MSPQSRQLILAAIVGLVSVPAIAQQNPRDRLIVTGQWLMEHINDPGLVVLHVGPEESYRAGHLPGARFAAFPAGAVREGATGLRLELTTQSAAQDSLRALGISDDSRTIVVYWADEWVTPTARTIFNLDWAGLGDRTVLLERGIVGWTDAGGRLSTEVPAPIAGNVTVRPRAELVVDAAWVQANAKALGVAIVDGRARVFYDGVRADRDKSGHIPGAGSIPWTELVDESLRLKPASELRRVFAAAGVEPNDTVVAYCHIGQYATMVMFAARTLGHPVKLYDGAFQDWAARDLPVETGTRP